MPSPSRHSDIDIPGGSTASRHVNCPGSNAILRTLPKQINLSSEWAEEGTDLHTLIAAMIDSDGSVFPVVGTTKVGETLITQELMHDCVMPCWEHWLQIRESVDEVAVEVEGQFPGIAGALGTCDLGGRNEKLNVTRLRDWKFGAGHSVSAEYPDPDDDRYVLVNEQLLFYACMVRGLYPDWFPKDVDIELGIVQPRNQDESLRVSLTHVTNEDLDDFQAELKEAVKIGRRPDAPKKIGPWCRFAPCKPLCPLWDAPLLDLSVIDPKSLQKDIGSETHSDALARILRLAPFAKAIIAEANKQALELMEAGQVVPGFKLVPSRPTRHWNQDDAATAKLLRKRFKMVNAQMYEPRELKSPAQIEKAKKGVKVGADLAAPVSSGNTIAPDTDKRQAVSGKHESLREILQLAVDHAEKPE